MNPITEEKRQALIAVAKQIVDSKSFETHQGEVIYPLICTLVKSKTLHELAKIALASLEAEPVAYMTYKGYLLHAADPKVAEHSEPDPLYGAPPVPVLKPIELNDDSTDEPIDWYAGAMTRDMVIAAIRKAGYEVKE